MRSIRTIQILLLVSAFAVSAFAAVPFSVSAVAQSPSSRSPAPPPSAFPIGSDELHDRQMKDAAKQANLQRQAALRSDTEKLYKLATELKESVDKSNANILSLDVLKKAEEIEKLARSVKDKMKGQN